MAILLFAAVRMADVCGTAAPWRRRLGLAADAVTARGRTAAVAALRQLETQPARHRIGLGQPEVEALADTVGFAALIADQGPRFLVVAEIFRAEVGGQHQAVAAQLVDRREEAERLDAGDPAADDLPDLVG